MDAGPPVLDGQVVLVTGARQGVGRGIALAAAGAGATVVVTARTAAGAASVVDEIAARGGLASAHGCDVTDPVQVALAVDAAMARHGRLDAVFANATSRHSNEVGPLGDVTDASWADQSAVGLRGLLHLAQSVRPHLAAVGGTLVVLVSTAGIDGSPGLPVYAAVKGAQRALVKSLAREWGPDGVRVNALAPVAVSEAMAGFLAGDPDLGSRLAARSPLGRLGDAEADVGPVAVFLASPASGFLTGQTLVANGGAVMR